MTSRSRGISRRRFLAASAAVASGALCGPARAARGSDQKLRIAVVGAGGRGAEDLKGVSTEHIVALCDCDARNAAESFRKYPSAKIYSDWRKLLDAEAKNIDAVIVATPDHNHAIVSVHAMKLGKHVYCEKPLAHSIWEARQMAKAAAENKVMTQMGTQGHAFPGTREAIEVMRSGVLGEVRELHVWTDRPAGWWPQGVARPTDTPPVPQGLDWDLWLGPAPYRPYNPAYVPFKWRGRWDFGTGPIGDMGIHNLDTAFWGLELTAPTRARVKDCQPALDAPEMKESPPLWSILEFDFPARGNKPPVKMTWYDGGKLPPKELFHGEPIPIRDGGSLVVGSKGTLLTRTWHGGEDKSNWYVLLPRKQFADYQPPVPKLPPPKVEPGQSAHHQEWIAACKGEGTPLSNFGYASVLTESLLIGNVALRVGNEIQWDAQNMHATNCPEANTFIHPQFRDGWSL